MADLTNLPSKLSRAIRYYLIAQGVVSADDCYHAYDSRTINLQGGPVISVEIAPLNPDVPFTGNDEFKVHICVKGNAANQPNTSNPDAARLAFDALVGAARMQLMLSDDGCQSLHATYKAINAAAYLMPVDASSGTNPTQTQFAANNADMADFTITGWYNGIYGQGAAKDCEWEVVQVFTASCCESQIVGYT